MFSDVCFLFLLSVLSKVINSHLKNNVIPSGGSSLPCLSHLRSFLALVSAIRIRMKPPEIKKSE